MHLGFCLFQLVSNRLPTLNNKMAHPGSGREGFFCLYGNRETQDEAAAAGE